MKSFLPFICACVLFASCDKDEPITEPKIKKSIYLTGTDFKRWNFTKETLDGTDITNIYKACELDNFHVFHVGSSYIIDAGNEQCQEDPEPLENRGSYKFNSDTTAMDIVVGDTSFTAKIVSLDDSKMIWEIDAPQGTYQRTFEAP